MTIQINKKDIRNHDVSNLFTYAKYQDNLDYFHFTDEEYLKTHALQLYAYLSSKFDNTTILDIGTKFGNSAIALSQNDNNKVVSYDIVEWPCYKNLNKKNIELKIENFMDDESIDYNNVSIILIDVDPHDGSQEPVMIDYLKNIEWSGLLLLDDISWSDFPELKKFWNELEYEKYDLTDVGHFSGTGLINFGNKYSIKVVE
jgi:hypothetical protein